MRVTRIRYLAYLSEDPTKLASFYCKYLQLQELGRSGPGDVSLTDGFYNITILRWRPALKEPHMGLGLHHIGMEVDDIEEVKARYLKYDPHGVVVEETGDIHHGTIRIFDPECNPITLSERDFGVGIEENRIPRVRHVAFNALAPDRLLSFHNEVLGLRELETSFERRRQKLGNRFAGDGFTNLAIHPFYDTKEGHEAGFGVNHIGFLVQNLQRTIDDLSDVAAVKPRPTNRPYAEFRFRDPEGNRLDLSQTKGWEVDVDKWVRAS
jgi:catechol 2,3-dioxygenase-like lactoylglutathione lyase family enzyme